MEEVDISDECEGDSPLSHPPTHDAPLTAQQYARSKRNRRKRDSVFFPITGRDEALYGLDAFAANELIRQPEVRARLALAAQLRGTHKWWEEWAALGALDGDLAGILRGPSELDRLRRRWSEIEAKLDWKLEDVAER